MREQRCPWPGMGWGGVRVARPPTLGDPPAQERAPDALRAPDACSSQCPIIPSGPTGAGSSAVHRTLADPAVPSGHSGPIVRAGPPCPMQPFQTSHRLSPSPPRSQTLPARSGSSIPSIPAPVSPRVAPGEAEPGRSALASGVWGASDPERGIPPVSAAAAALPKAHPHRSFTPKGARSWPAPLQWDKRRVGLDPLDPLLPRLRVERASSSTTTTHHCPSPPSPALQSRG